MPSPTHQASRLLPGVALCFAVTLGAWVLARLEQRVFGAAWLESLVLAIVLGTALRTAWSPGPRWAPGVAFCAKTLLEVAVVLLGASVSARAVMAAGTGLLGGIVAVVAVAIAASYGLGRWLGLSHRLALLVACGNSICGNSAIAAVAPVIGADGDDVASSIAFTAVLGVAVVLTLPLMVPLLHPSGRQYGVFAGLTVYAVPQVLAATVPVGPVAVQIGTLVKLMRVLMLGPVVLGLSLLTRSRRVARGADPATPAQPLALHRLVPWFIIGFFVFACLRSAGLVPQAALAPIGTAAGWLTVMSMAALGLGTDLRMVSRAGGRVTATVVLSLVVLGVISAGLIALLRLG